MKPFDWTEVAADPCWKRRNLAVWEAVETFLDGFPSSAGPLSTMELAAVLAPNSDKEAVGRLASVLVRVGKWMKRAYVTRDGEEYQAFGKTYRRYRWHGQQGKEQV